MPRLAIIIPYADSGCPYRRRAVERVWKHLLAEFGEACVAAWYISCDNCGDGRNRGARIAPTDTDVLVFNDADCIVPHAQIRQAAWLASQQPGLVFAFTGYRREDAGGEIGPPHASDAHGCVAISRACFDEIGGYDEGYVGYGFEDLAFTREATRRWGPPRRVPGELVHLWHPPFDRDSDAYRANEARYQSGQPA